MQTCRQQDPEPGGRFWLVVYFFTAARRASAEAPQTKKKEKNGRSLFVRAAVTQFQYNAALISAALWDYETAVRAIWSLMLH